MKTLFLNLKLLVLIFLSLTTLVVWAEPGPLTPSGPPGPTGASLIELEEKLNLILAYVTPDIEITNASQSINKPGHYHLSNDLTNSFGIIVNADNVIIDGQNHNLFATPLGSPVGLLILGSKTNVVVKHLTVGGFSTSISGNASSITVDHSFTDRNIEVGSGSKVIGCFVTDSGTATNPAVNVGHDSIVENTWVKSWGTSSNANCFEVGSHSKVKGCKAVSGYNGFVGDAYCIFSDCQSVSNANSGFVGGVGNGFSQNYSLFNGGDGMVLAGDSKAGLNTVQSNGLSGIKVTGNACDVSFNHVTENNTMTNSNSGGIVIGANKCLIEANFLSGNAQYGVYVFSTNNNNVVIKNVAIGNGTSSAFNYQVNGATNDFGSTANIATSSQSNLNSSR